MKKSALVETRASVAGVAFLASASDSNSTLRDHCSPLGLIGDARNLAEDIDDVIFVLFPVEKQQKDRNQKEEKEKNEKNEKNNHRHHHHHHHEEEDEGQDLLGLNETAEILKELTFGIYGCQQVRYSQMKICLLGLFFLFFYIFGLLYFFSVADA